MNEWMNDRNVEGKDICYTNVWLVTFSLSVPGLDRASSCLPQGQWLGFFGPLNTLVQSGPTRAEVWLLVWSLERVSAINHFIYSIYVSPQSLVPQMLNASVLKYLKGSFLFTQVLLILLTFTSFNSKENIKTFTCIYFPGPFITFATAKCKN